MHSRRTTHHVKWQSCRKTFFLQQRMAGSNFAHHLSGAFGMMVWNRKMEADLVMLATGFDGHKKLKWIFPEHFRHYIQDSTGIMPLYRGTVHPLIPHMAFVGYIESVSNLHTAELRCKWLARLLEDAFVLPTVEKIVSQISTEMEITKSTTRFSKRQCISTFSISHSDEMCEEMGLRPWRKRNWFQEIFSPYSNRDYKDD